MRGLKRKLAVFLSISMILMGIMPAYAAVIPEEEIEEVVEVAEAEEIETEEVEEIEATEVVEEIAQEQISEDTEKVSEEEIADEEISGTDMLGDAPDDLFCFEAVSEATVSICCMNPWASYSDVKLKYATASNNGTFNDYKPYELVAGGEGEQIVLKNREKLSFIASDSNPYISRSNAQIKFSFSGDLKVKGKIAYLLASNGNATASNYCFNYLFSIEGNANAGSLDASELILLKDTAPSCYEYMFGNNSLLTKAPVLPATELANSCYEQMFNSCTSLTQAPALPATGLAKRCYYEMFYGCASLSQAPALPATELAPRCYQYMFSGCSHLSSVTVGFNDWFAVNEPTESWLSGVSQTGTFTCPKELTTDVRGESNIPEGWTIVRIGEQQNVRSSSGRTSTLFTGTWGNPVTGGVWNYYPDTDIWTYTYIRLFRNTWGYITNPWNNNEPAWFYFDSTGKMLTGWQHLQWNGSLRWFYFHELKDGHRGECQLGGITPDGYLLDNNGCLIE